MNEQADWKSMMEHDFCNDGFNPNDQCFYIEKYVSHLSSGLTINLCDGPFSLYDAFAVAENYRYIPSMFRDSVLYDAYEDGVGKLFYGVGLNSGGLIYISYGQPRSELSTSI